MSGHRNTGGIATSNASLVAAIFTLRCKAVYLDVLDLSRSEATTNRLLQDGLSLRDQIHQYWAKKEHMARDFQVVPKLPPQSPSGPPGSHPENQVGNLYRISLSATSGLLGTSRPCWSSAGPSTMTVLLNVSRTL
ncbi:hypothetical protein LTS15_004376 [Exophiala xenobiotica]|nr:hypothetical protein LTS15_004376 [Exophiala xenobiotica]